jgi:hypothetical protein
MSSFNPFEALSTRFFMNADEKCRCQKNAQPDFHQILKIVVVFNKH